MSEQRIRIQKFLSENGVCSRRKAEELIKNGVVLINHQPALIGQSVGSDDVIHVDGRIVEKTTEKVVIMLNKPRGFVTTMQDPHARRCVTDLLTDRPERLYPVGRLDKDSEGLLLLTNDGDFAQKILHPSQHICKVYQVALRGSITEAHLNAFAQGLMLDGRKTLPIMAKISSTSLDKTVLELTLHEGRNRQIRRMCEQLELVILRLKRTAVGSLRLGTLPTGAFRVLTLGEIRSFFEKY